jgi:hypothetical protein
MNCSSSSGPLRLPHDSNEPAPPLPFLSLSPNNYTHVVLVPTRPLLCHCLLPRVVARGVCAGGIHTERPPRRWQAGTRVTSVGEHEEEAHNTTVCGCGSEATRWRRSASPTRGHGFCSGCTPLPSLPRMPTVTSHP